MEKKVKVAICIPYYKKTEALRRLLESIRKQTFQDYVVIVTDDSSDAGAKELIAHLDERFNYSCNQVRLGPTRNCNQAIRLARAYHPEYIKVMHHDDYFTCDESLEEYVKLLDQNPEAVLGFSGAKVETAKGHQVYETAASEDQLRCLREDKYCILETNFIGNPSGVIVRDLGIFMDENLVWLVDVDWYMKFMEYRFSFAWTPKALVGVGFDGDNLTDHCLTDLALQQKEFLYVYMKHSAMQDFSSLGRIIEICTAYYHGQPGFWHEDDYTMILKDAVRDGKRLCLWGESEMEAEAVCEMLRQKGLKACWPRKKEPQRAGEQGELWLIMLDRAKKVRKALAGRGINSLPYIERYVKKFLDSMKNR